MYDGCGYEYNHALVKYFRVEQGALSRSEIETLVIDEPLLSIDCGYYVGAWTFNGGVPTDSLDGGITLTVDGEVTVTEDGIAVDITDSLTLQGVFTDADILGSVQVVFTGEIIENDGDDDEKPVIILSSGEEERQFLREGNTMTDGGNLFSGHEDGDWVLSAGFIDNNLEMSDEKERVMDFSLWEVGEDALEHEDSG